nr:NAD-binding protein [Pseudomonas sp. Teo4]
MPQVVVAGLGRMGAAIVRMLHGEGVRLVALDASVDAVVQGSEKDGPLVFFGDPSRSEILRAARVDQARLVIVATDDPQSNLKTADVLAHLYPQTPVIAAARDSQEAQRLLAMGADPVRETFHSSLEMARRALIMLGYSEEQAAAWVHRYSRQEARRLQEQRQWQDGSGGDFPNAR